MTDSDKAIVNFVTTLDTARIDSYIEIIQAQNRGMDRLDGWFLAREIMMNTMLGLRGDLSPAETQAMLLDAVARDIPISIRDGEIFAGTESDSFARSYALINPSFKVDGFEGYCDEESVYNDIGPNAKFNETRIAAVRKFWSDQPYAKNLRAVYEETGLETREVVYFVERVTGHTIPDFRDALEKGLEVLIDEIAVKSKGDILKSGYYEAMTRSLDAAVLLAERYAALAEEKAARESSTERRQELRLIAQTCRRVPRHGARNLYEAMQSYIILWQIMNLEQSPNPFAFSVGNLDRVLQPYYERELISPELAVQLTRHFLAFFCVGDRNWAISQNIIIGGSDKNGKDLTNDMSFIIIKAFAQFNYSQPNLSVKLSPATPDAVYNEIAATMFEFGAATPSFFNDPVMFKTLETKGIAREDLSLYGIAGCQEPLIMGNESANTTNSWLNLAKILELTLNNGVSAISGKRIAPPPAELGLPENSLESYSGIKKAFYAYIEYFLPRMTRAANACTEALSLNPIPFHSAFMGARETGIDMRDTTGRGTKYNGSGCLIHGMANVADSFSALKFIEENGNHHGFSIQDVLDAVKTNFKDNSELRDLLLTKPPRYGNNNEVADSEAVELVKNINTKVNALINPFGASFCADWSTPSTNLLYGYHTGATPDGRVSRAPLNYGIDPSVSSGRNGLLARVNSQAKLDYAGMRGGSASAMSVNPERLAGKTTDEKAKYLKEIMSFIFDYNRGRNGESGLMYVYFNVYSPHQLKHVMEHPEEYPNPVIVRIHGQYGDARHLSPDVLGMDIIPKLDPLSTAF